MQFVRAEQIASVGWIGIIAALGLFADPAHGAYTVQRVVGGLNQPIYMTQAPGDNTSIYIVERADAGSQLGKIRRFNLQTQAFTTFLDPSGTVTADGGLLSMTFHPEYQSNGLFYVVSNNSGTNGLDEYQTIAGAPVLQRRLLQYQNLDNVFHTLNQAHFRPGGNDSELFVTAGDGGTQADDPDFNKALIESPTSPYGKLMKIDLTQPFTTPATAPGPGTGISVVALGLRNPYRSAFDRQTGDFYIGDVGFITAEEVDFIPASHFSNPAPPVLDFGWTDREGTVARPPLPPGSGSPGDINPIFDYAHSGNPLPHPSALFGLSITAGYVYRGPVTELQGRYFFADFVNNGSSNTTIYSGTFNTSTPVASYNGTNLTGITNHTAAYEALVGGGADIRAVTSFAEDNAGNLYIVKFGNGFFPPLGQGEIFRIAPVGLSVVVERESGAITLTNNTGAAISLTSLSMTSSFGAIDRSRLTPITGNYDSTGSGIVDNNNPWAITSPVGSHTQFTEISTGDPGTLASGQQISLSTMGGWIQSPTEDLAVHVLLSGGGGVLNGAVSYVGNEGQPLARGDLDFNGEIDAGDWAVFVANAYVNLSDLSDAQSYGKGDLDGDGDNDYADFKLFKRDFNAANGFGSFEAMLEQAPEPASTVLALFGLSASLIAVRSRRRRVFTTRFQRISFHAGGRMMHSLGYSAQSATGKLLGAIVVAAAMTSATRADMVHKYTFNANSANDSIGIGHGTLVDATGIASYTGGSLNLTANNNIPSNALNTPGSAGTFVDLPNDIFTNAVNDATGTGEIGQITLEMWLTVQQNRTWAEAFVFGTSTGGENISDNGDNQSYVALIPQSGVGPGDFRGTTRSPAAEVGIPNGPPLPINQRHHIVMTLDALDSTAGPNGTVKLYLNNGAPATAAIQPLIDLMTNNNNWLGRSLFGGDPLLDGLIDEFRIYNHALSAADVTASFNTGPEAAPVPVLVVDRTANTISLANQTAGNIQLKGYAITSAAGSLNVAGWTSIDTDNTFDPNGTWTTQSLTSTNITESNTGSVLDGGSLLASTSRGIGTPWTKSPFQDLQFSFTLGDGTTGSGLVQYIGAPAVRSDLNGDGGVTPADWALFISNGFTSFPADLAVAAYKRGDIDGDKDNDYADFKLFKSDYIQVNGLAAFQALAGGVPEPGALPLAVLAVAALLAAKRRGDA